MEEEAGLGERFPLLRVGRVQHPQNQTSMSESFHSVRIY